MMLLERNIKYYVVNINIRHPRITHNWYNIYRVSELHEYSLSLYQSCMFRLILWVLYQAAPTVLLHNASSPCQQQPLKISVREQ